MLKHNEIGIKGEEIAREFLKNKGYSIINTNWRSGNKEIDIIAEDNGVFVFVEVKTRKSVSFSYPEEFISTRQKNNLRTAGVNYYNINCLSGAYRFDVVSIVFRHNAIKEIQHFENAF